jgi:MerR family transcriptional regulator, thiopeptide resistance regulator
MKPRHYQVSQVAELSGVSVRTLHHYDQLGLLSPSARSQAGYRLYADADLLRLQQILVHRELGLSLEEIRKLLDDPAFDRVAALQKQRAQLAERAAHVAAMIRAIDHALILAKQPTQPTHQGAISMRPDEDMRNLFEGFDPAQYAEEAEQRWGHTDYYKESQRRTSRYTPEDWQRFRDENQALMQALVAAQSGGSAPTAPETLALAEQHRLLVDRWFYPCSHEMHTRLADMYESDARFAQNIDAFGPGLTALLVAAIRGNASGG